MAVNLSKFEGVPTTLSSANKQFNKLYVSEQNYPYNRGRFLVLKINQEGKYKGLPNVWVYENKPKDMSKVLKIRQFPKEDKKKTNIKNMIKKGEARRKFGLDTSSGSRYNYLRNKGYSDYDVQYEIFKDKLR